MIEDLDNMQGPENEIFDEETDEYVETTNGDMTDDDTETGSGQGKFADKESSDLGDDEVVGMENKTISDPPKIPKKRKQKVAVKTSMVREYYKQYIDYVRQHKPDKAILSFTNMVNTLLRNFNVNDANYIVERLRKDATLLSYKVALQQINLIPAASRIKVETIFVLIMGLVKKNKQIDFNKVREFIGNQDVVNYFIKRYKRL